jgi:hypothetical protein
VAEEIVNNYFSGCLYKVYKMAEKNVLKFFWKKSIKVYQIDIIIYVHSLVLALKPRTSAE